MIYKNGERKRDVLCLFIFVVYSQLGASRLVGYLSSPTRAHGIIVKYTIMANPMKTLKLHYPMIQFLIKADKPRGILVEHAKNS